ncbi:helicase [Streptomyces sp. CAU 1734]|uniref:HelD family protein n=1 Tax=Streptomyces sp. CAU 1734 TaxID=3140360 RepID=UPI00326121C6
MRDEQQFVTFLRDRLEELRAAAESAVRSTIRATGTGHQARMERDVSVAEHSAQLAALNAVDSGLCFGRIDLRDGARHHIGRVGMRRDDSERTPVLIDWRAPVARPFYLATGHEPMGLTRRRHITTDGWTVTALHDEILDLADATRTGHEDPGGDAVLLAALGAARTGRMTDIVQTIQAEQDRIIRAPRQGILVVEGGPGTGKTAVALHRAAYLLYAHREQLARRAVLIVGPNPAFLGYIGEVLPALGETGVLLATMAELYPGVTADGTDTPAAAEVKGRAGTAEALAAFVRSRQRLPDTVPDADTDHEAQGLVPEPALEIEHQGYGVLRLHREMAHRARDRARATALPHNPARPHFAFAVIDALTEQLADRLGADPYGGPNLLGPDDIAQLGKEIATSAEVHAAIEELWPHLTPERLVADFLAEPHGHGRLPDADAELIRRSGGPWTPADVPLLDEAAELLGTDDSAARAAAEAEQRDRIAYAQGVLDLSAGSKTFEFEDEESEILAAHDIIDAERMAERHEERDDRTAAERAAADRTWAFGHIIVDEAQELSAMAWRLLMRRCPTRSMTLVGDPAQTGDIAGVGSWEKILGPYVGDRWEHTRLALNYRTPAEIMEPAAAVLRAASPGFEPPRSVRSTGVPPRFDRAARTADLGAAVTAAIRREVPDFGADAPVPEHEAGTAAPGRGPDAPAPACGTAASVPAGGTAAPVPAGGTAAPDQEPGRIAVIAPPELHALLPLPAGPPDLTGRVVLLAPRQAKGLEFDSVIVVEPALLGPSDLYVALTRATQRLAVVHTGELPAGLEPAV